MVSSVCLASLSRECELGGIRRLNRLFGLDPHDRRRSSFEAGLVSRDSIDLSSAGGKAASSLRSSAAFPPCLMTPQETCPDNIRDSTAPYRFTEFKLATAVGKLAGEQDVETVIDYIHRPPNPLLIWSREHGVVFRG